MLRRPMNKDARPVVRMATPADIDILLDLGDRQIAEMPEPHPIPDRDGFLEMLSYAGNRGVIFLAFDNDTPVGWLAGEIGGMFYDQREFAFVNPIYVVPEARGKIYAHRLLAEFEEWAAPYEVSAIAISTSSQIANVDADRFVTGHGYKERGTIYTKEFNT